MPEYLATPAPGEGTEQAAAPEQEAPERQIAADATEGPGATKEATKEAATGKAAKRDPGKEEAEEGAVARAGAGGAEGEEGEAALTKQEEKPPPPVPPPPELGGIIARPIPIPPPMPRDQMLDVLARTGRRPEAHHAAIRQRLDGIATRARALQDDIVRAARMAAADAVALFATKADAVPGMMAEGEERVRGVYAAARARVSDAADKALGAIARHKVASTTKLDASSLSMEQQIQRILASGSPEVQALHQEQMAVVDAALGGFAKRFETDWGGEEKAIRESPPRAVSSAAPTPDQIEAAGLPQSTPWAEIAPARREAEEQSWSRRTAEMADDVRRSIDGNSAQVLAQRESFSLSILRLVNPAAVQMEEVAAHEEGEVAGARKETRVRIATDYERAVNTVTQFRDRALKNLDQGEKGVLKELRAIRSRLEQDMRLRGATLESSIGETARDFAEAYRVQMGGVNDSLEIEGFVELGRVEPLLTGAERRFEEMYAEQSEGLDTTVADTIAGADANAESQLRSAAEMVDKAVSEASRMAGDHVDAIDGAKEAFGRAVEAPADSVTGRAAPYTAAASEKLGGRPAQVRAAVARMLDVMRKTLDETLAAEKARLQKVARNLEQDLRASLVADGLKTISDLNDRLRRAYNAMAGPGTDEAALMGALRNITKTQGAVMEAIWDKLIDPGESLREWLEDDLSGDEARAAFAYLSGDTAAGARWELEASMRWYGDDEDRIEQVLRDLQQPPPPGGQIKALQNTPGWAQTHARLRSNLGGTDLDVADALLVGNRHRADALRLRDKIEAARRKGDHDALHKLLEGVPDHEMADVRRELAAVKRGLGPESKKRLEITEKEASDEFVSFVTENRVVPDPHAREPGPRTRTMTITGANKELAVLLASRSGRPDDVESRVAIRTARMEVETTRRGDPNLENLQRGFEFDEGAELDPELDSPDPGTKKRAEKRREEARRERTLALQRFAGRRLGRKDVTEKEARDYAAGTVEKLFDSKEGHEFGRSMVEKGFADPAAAMRLAVEGAGTDEDLIKRTLRRLDRDEIQRLKDVYRDRYKEDLDKRLGTNQPKRDERRALAAMAISPLAGAAMLAAPAGELSGDERLEVELLMHGRPRNDRERYELEEARTEQQRKETGFAGKSLMAGSRDERLMNQGHQRMVDIVARAGGVEKAFDKDGRFIGANPKPDEHGVLQPNQEEAWAFGEELKWNQFGAEAYQAGIDRITNFIATALAVIAAVVVAIAIPGAGGAIAGAIIGGLLSMATKAALKGGRYGWEEAAVDLAVTAADAATAGLTHAVGAALRGAASAGRGAAGAIARRTPALLGGLASRGRVGRAAAYVASEGLENFVGSVPSAFVGQVLNDRNWKGGSPFENILTGTFIEAGISTGIGLGVGTGMDLASGAIGAVRGSLRERSLRTQLLASVPGDARHAFSDVPILELSPSQFDQLAGSRSGQAVTIITPDGPVIYVRQGANPRVLREEGIHLMQSREGEWGGRIAALNEGNLARWNDMSLGEQIELYRLKFDVEIDAQRRLLLDLGDELALAGPLARRGLRKRIAEVETALSNLERLRIDVERITPERIQRISTGEETLPRYLDAPPRLFMKKAKPSGKAKGEEPEIARVELPATPGHPDYSPLSGRSDVTGTIVEIGPRWVEASGREYRLVGVVDEAGNITHLRQEIRSAHEDQRWVQRGSESQKRGEIAEAASRRMSAVDARPGWDTRAIPSQWDPSGRGFDEVLLDFRMEGDELVARVRVIEVKDYPDRYVPLESFTAVRPPPDGSLNDNLQFIRARLRDVGTLPPPKGFGLTPEQREAALDAIAIRAIELDIRVTPSTSVGARERGTVLKSLEEEWKDFGIAVDIRVVEIDAAHLRAAQAESAPTGLPATPEAAVQASTARERRALRERAYRNELERSVPPPMRASMADVPIVEVPAAEFRRLTGSDSGQAVTFIMQSGPVVLVKEGADPRVLREEGIHVLQSRTREWADKVAALSEANLARWHGMSLTEQLALYRVKVEIEIDAQRRLLADLGKELEVAGGAARPVIAKQMMEAQATLANLTQRLKELDAITPALAKRMAAGKQARPEYLAEPPRLFSKRRRGRRGDPPEPGRAAPPQPPTVPPQRILVVGAETEGEFQYAADMAALGRDVTILNPERITPEAERYVEGGGPGFRQAPIEQLPNEPTFNVIREDYPYPLGTLLPVVETFVGERAGRLLPGGRWFVTTEGPWDEFPATLEYAAARAGLDVTVREIPVHHEGTPPSGYPRSRERYELIITRPPAAGEQAAPAVPRRPAGGGAPPPAGAPPGSRLDGLRLQQLRVEAQIQKSVTRERVALSSGRAGRARAIADAREELTREARRIALEIESELQRVLPQLAGGLDPPVPVLIDAIRESRKGGRRIDAQQRIDSLRNRSRHDEPPHYGHLEGFIAQEVLAQNVVAVQQIRSRIAEVQPDAVLAVERGGSFLADVLKHGQASFPPVHSVQKGAKGERIPNLEARLNDLIRQGQSSFVIVDFYMGGIFAEELREMIARTLRSHPNVTIERVWMGESEGFERLLAPITPQDLRALPPGEGIATTGAFITVVDGRVRFRRGVPGVALPVVRGTVENAPQIVQTRVPVAVVLGDDMACVFDPESRTPIRLFDRNGRIVQEIRVPATDPVTGEELETVREIVIRLMNGVEFPRNQ